jgi:hypothetical protein
MKVVNVEVRSACILEVVVVAEERREIIIWR